MKQEERLGCKWCKYYASNNGTSYCTHKSNYDYRTRGNKTKRLRHKRCDKLYCPLHLSS